MRAVAWALCGALLSALLTLTAASAEDLELKIVRCPSAPQDAGVDITSKQDTAALLARLPPLFKAIELESRPEVVRLLAAQPNVNACAFGTSPLMLSAVTGNVQIATLLLDAGAKADAPRDASGGTALHSAVSFGRWNVARLLLARGADPRLVTDGGISVLHQMAMAAPQADDSDRAQQLAIAREFIQRGVAVDGVSGPNKSTPLMLAALSGNRELVALLLEHGANPQLTNKRGESALSFARLKQHQAIVRLLEQAPARPVR